MKRFATVLALISLAFVAGCGSSTTQSTPVSGIVADGYLRNAVVFLDKNLNYQLDQGEPSTTTDQNGAYSLTLDPADVGKYPIVAIAIKDQTIDTDTGLAVSASYVLCIPKTAVSGTVSNFISPFSTLLREKLEANPGMTLAEAMAQLRSQLNMPAGVNMMADYVAGSATGSYQTQYQQMHQVARQMASLMGEQSAQVMVGTTGANISRFRGMMGQMNQYLPQITYNATSGMGMNSDFMQTLRNQMQAGITSGFAVYSSQYTQLFRNMTSSRYFWNYSGSTMRPSSGMTSGGMTWGGMTWGGMTR